MGRPRSALLCIADSVAQERFGGSGFELWETFAMLWQNEVIW
jgi:hypothetical protein